MIVYVKSKPDREAVTHVFKRVYGWTPVIKALSVEHKELNNAIEDISEDDFVVILLGSEECRWVSTQDSPTKKVVCFWKSKVRNGRMRDLVNLIETAKMSFIYDVGWREVYVFGRESLIGRKEPGGDVYFVPEEWKYRDLLSSIVGKEVGTPLVHALHGTDILYSGKEVIATVPRNGGRVVLRDADPVFIEKGNLVKENKKSLEEKVEVTKKKIKRVLGKFDEVIVPFSGGKDSATVALLLKETGVEFTPIFVDTGGEYEETRRYVELMERYVGSVEIVEAPVAENYKKVGKDYLLRRDCTKDKIGSLYDFVRRNFENPVLVNGDRISESRARSFRPELRRDEFWVFSPIQLWSYFNEQLFFWDRGIPFNELYTMGFYRVGCSFCPFTDLIERLSVRRYTV